MTRKFLSGFMISGLLAYHKYVGIHRYFQRALIRTQLF